MSYDIYCYKSKLGKPDADEADSIIGDEVEEGNIADSSISNLLLNYDKNLEQFGQSEDNESIELNSKEGSPTIQLSIFSNHVAINVPYWYQGSEVDKIMLSIKGYIRVLRTNAGYFVYDPQTGNAFDPAENDFDGLDQYLSITEKLDSIMKEQPKKKPWWKIW